MKRRDLLTGAAALPFAGVAMPAAANDDAALDAACRWLAAVDAQEAFDRDNDNWEDGDPVAVALADEEERCWAAMLSTPPLTPAGLALMLACFTYRSEAVARGSHFSNPESWYFEGTAGQGTLYALLPALWNSPAAAELFPRTAPPTA